MLIKCFKYREVHMLHYTKNEVLHYELFSKNLAKVTSSLTRFQSIFPFYTLLLSHFIPPENTRKSLFSGAFREYKVQKLTRNGLSIKFKQGELVTKFVLINLKRLTEYLKTVNTNCFLHIEHHLEQRWPKQIIFCVNCLFLGAKVKLYL